MKKIKNKKGITLIALIITIVVLLILAMVSVQLVMNEGILGYAQNAVISWNQAEINESQAISGYENVMNQYTPLVPKVEYYISNDRSGMEIIQKLDYNNLLITTYFKGSNEEYSKDADTQLEVGEAIVESITINAYNYDTATAYSQTLQPGTKVYNINIDGQRITALYVTDNEIYGLSDYGYAVFDLVTDESKIAEIETGISNIK